MSQGMGDSLEELRAAREAFQRHAWPEAHERFAAIDEAGTLGPADLERFGEAAWWLARLEEAIALRERAYSAYAAAGDRVGAARVALWLFPDYASRLQPVLARGALTRAERQLAHEPPGPAHSQLAFIQALAAHDEGDHDRSLALARRAEELAVAADDRDLESLSLLMQGRVLAERGDVEEGMELLDRSAAAAVGGELAAFTTGVIYCMTITACTELADYRRAGEWTEAAERWCAQQAMDSGFPGACRVFRAGVKRFNGAWSEAEQEARRAAEELQDSFLDVAGAAHNEIGEIRLRLGDLGGAEEAFRRAHESGHEAQPGISLLRLAQGQVDTAAASISTALENPFLQPLGRARLLPAKVEIALAAGDTDEAATAAEELQSIADAYRTPSPVLDATARRARAAVALAAGDPGQALTLLRPALRDWQQLRAPYEVASTRLLLARVHRQLGNEDAAMFEARAARSGFDRLGATRDAHRAAALVGDAVAPRPVSRTFLFTDIVTSTSLVDALGDDAWADVLRWHDQTLRDLFRAHGGEVVEHTGDGFFVAFMTPAEALRAAVAVQGRLREHRRAHGFAPKVRIGVHATKALAEGGNYHGRGVHETARIAALAEADQILASAPAIEAAGDEFVVASPRPVKLRGVAEPVEVADVRWEDAPLPG